MPGLKTRSQAASTVLGLLIGFSASAEERLPESTKPADAALPAAFLEYLGEWDEQEGGWHDPMEFAGPEWQQLIDEAKRDYETD